MSLFVAALIIVGSAAAGAVAMVALTRFAPHGGRFADTQRAAGVFTVVGTGFAMVLAFVVLVAFQSYNRATDAAETEAVATVDLFDTAALLPPAAAARVRRALVCYGRAVVKDEWPDMRESHASPVVDARVEQVLAAARPPLRRGAPGGEHFLTANATRAEARSERLTEARPFVPAPAWLVLGLGTLVVLTFVGLFADRGEGGLVAAAQMAAVVAILVSGLVLVAFLDAPYEGHSGSITPRAMRIALKSMPLAEPARCGAPV